jgi:polyketide synthase 12/myxalamid-type polyketide synthase MxaF
MRAQGDVSQEADVRAMLDAAARELPPINQVFHCAGALDDGVLMQMTSGRFHTVLAPKVHGAYWLDRLTRKLPIERFVLFSSWASMLGSPGQANHSAANSYLDALAHARRSAGLPAQSINWGPWTEIGAAAGYADRLGSRGVGCFSPREGLRALEWLLSEGVTQAAVMPFDVAQWCASAPAVARSRLFAALKQARTASEETKSTDASRAEGAETVLAMMAGTSDPRQRSRLLERWLRDQAAAVLRLPVARVDVGKPLKSQGFDSLLAVEFRNRLESNLRLQLPAAIVWNYPTLSQLTKGLLERMDGGQDPPVVATESGGSERRREEPGSASLDVEMLTDAEAEEQLEQRLQGLEGRL